MRAPHTAEKASICSARSYSVASQKLSVGSHLGIQDGGDERLYEPRKHHDTDSCDASQGEHDEGNTIREYA